MSQRIIRIENAGPAFRARRIFFDGDPEPRTTSAAVVKRLGIEADTDVDRDDLELKIATEEVPLAKERALQLLGYRERSAAELLSKLKDGGYPESVASAIVQRYQEVELVDDTRFAFAWARSRLAAGYGARRISRELAEKGVSPEVVTSALEQAGEPADEPELALNSLRGRAPRDRQDGQRLVRRLLGRGFSMSAALCAVESARLATQSRAGDDTDGDTLNDLR